MPSAAKDMDPEDIKAALRKRGRTFAGLAAATGISRQCMVATLTRAAKRNEEVIAKAIGLSPAAIWPSRYDPRTGKRLRPQPAANYRPTYRFSKRGQ